MTVQIHWYVFKMNFISCIKKMHFREVPLLYTAYSGNCLKREFSAIWTDFLMFTNVLIKMEEKGNLPN